MSGAVGTAAAPLASTSAGHLDDRVVRQERQRAVVADVDRVQAAVVAAQRGDQADGGLRVERAAALRRAAPAWCRRSGRRTCRSSSASISATASPRVLAPELLARRPRRGRRSSAGSTTGRSRSVASSSAAVSTSSAMLARCVGEQLGQPVDAVDVRGALPGQVVEPDVVEDHRRAAATPSMPANRRWKPIATLHSPTARWPASSRARVTMPTGLVKSTIQASGCGPARGPLGDVEHHRHRAQRLGEAAGAGGLLADAAALERERLVADPGRLAADAQLDQHDVGAVADPRPDRTVQRTRPGWP